MKYQRSMVGAVILAVSVALTACGSSNEIGNDDGAASQADKKVIELTDQPGSVEDYTGALEDAELETCSHGAGGLEVAGTVSNPETSAQDYRIYISAMAGDDTVGLVQVDVDNVAGGDTAEWDNLLDLTQEDLECVLRVERFSAE